jgi:hypothetical protein
LCSVPGKRADGGICGLGGCVEQSLASYREVSGRGRRNDLPYHTIATSILDARGE